MQETFLLDGTGSAVDHNEPESLFLLRGFQALNICVWRRAETEPANSPRLRRKASSRRGVTARSGVAGGRARQTKSLFVSVSQSGRKGQFAANRLRRLPSAGVVTSRSALGASPRNAGAELEAKSPLSS